MERSLAVLRILLCALWCEVLLHGSLHTDSEGLQTRCNTAEI
ncbi:Uncharacterised protein [Segatella copri]|nr:Uncharacterised protein [Segatella copri]